MNTHPPLVLDSNELVAPRSDSSYSADIEVVLRWLQVYQKRSPNTFRKYSFEVRRLLAFLSTRYPYDTRSLLAVASENDMDVYLTALGRPIQESKESEPEDEAIPFKPLYLEQRTLDAFGLKAQPFLKEHSNRSIDLAVNVTSALYEFLKVPLNPGEAALVQHNPMIRLSKLTSRESTLSKRVFSADVYLQMQGTVKQMIADAVTTTQRIQAYRAQWVVGLMFNEWLRLAEAAKLTFGSFTLSDGVWLLTVRGKGRKVREIVVTDEVMRYCTTYRHAIGLGASTADELKKIPAILPTIKRKDLGENRFCSASSIYRLIKAVALETATRLQRESGEHPSEDRQRDINALNSLSPHWFRHSGASEMINAGLPLVDASAQLGHASVVTTQKMYYHGDLKRVRSAMNTIASGRALKPTIELDQ